MSLNEMLRFQGMNPADLKHDNISDKEFGQQIGNAMSVNVIERILFQIFKSFRIPESDKLVDRWLKGQGIKSIQTCEPNPGEILGGTPQILASSKDEKYIVDSGASFHLADSATLNRKERKTLYKLESPIPINTANGEITIEYGCAVYVKELKIEVAALCYPDAPRILSAGKLCSENGYSFVMESGEVPYLTKNGIRVYCPSIHNVPTVTEAIKAEGNLLPGTQADPPDPPRV